MKTKCFTSYVKISIYRQFLYMLKYHTYYNICTYNITPVGFIGNINNDLRFSVDKSYRERDRKIHVKNYNLK